MVSKQHWYVKRGEQVKGPFQALQIQKYGSLGRVRASDLLSVDRLNWRQAAHCEELFPGGRMDAMKLEPKDDERRVSDKRQAEGDVKKDPGPATTATAVQPEAERREQESPEVLKRREQRERVLQSLWSERQSERFPAVLVIVLIIVIALAGWYLTPTQVRDVPDCEAAIAPGVNWNNCSREQAILNEVDLSQAKLRNTRFMGASLQAARLDQADLSYANLMQANLGYVSLKQANLLGANLKFADLSNANLSGANLSYADLSQAKLGGADLSSAILENAIWIDGRICLKGSMGRCLQSQP